jgi:hypothetical protein
MPELILDIEIDYDNNRISTRRVSVYEYKWIEQKTAVVINGYCRLRRPWKTQASCGTMA